MKTKLITLAALALCALPAAAQVARPVFPPTTATAPLSVSQGKVSLNIGAGLTVSAGALTAPYSYTLTLSELSAALGYTPLEITSVGTGLSAVNGLLTNTYTYALPDATATTLGGVTVPAAGGLTVTGGAVSEAQPITAIGSNLALSAGTLSDTYSLTSAAIDAALGFTPLAPFPSEAAGTVFAAPAGAAGTPGFRALVASDLPLSNPISPGIVEVGTGLTSLGGGIVNVTNPVPNGMAYQTTHENSAGSSLATDSGLLDDGVHCSIGLPIDVNSALQVAPTGTAENGLSVVMPSGATGNAIQMIANNTANPFGAYQGFVVSPSGSYSVSGGTVSSPMTFGGATSSVVRGLFGDQNEVIQGGATLKMQIFSYHGIEVHGAEAGSPGAFVHGGAVADIGMDIFQSTTSNVPFGIQAVSGATGDLLDATSSSGIRGNLLKVAASGALTSASTVTATSFASSIRSVSAATDSQTTNDALIEFSVASTETLLPAASWKGQKLVLADLGANAITVTGTVLGAPADSLSAAGQTETFESDGVNILLLK